MFAIGKYTSEFCMELLSIQLSHYRQVMLNGVIMYLRCVSMTVVHMPEAPTQKTRTISLDTRIRKSSAPTRRHSYAINLQCKTYYWRSTFLTKHFWMVFAHLNIYSFWNRHLQAIMVKWNNCVMKFSLSNNEVSSKLSLEIIVFVIFVHHQTQPVLVNKTFYINSTDIYVLNLSVYIRLVK